MHCLPIINNTKTGFRLNSMLLTTYRMPNIRRGPKRAVTLTQTFLPFNPNHLVLDQSLSFLAFHLYSNVDSGRCWFVIVQNWRMPPQNGDLLEGLKSRTEESFFPCQLTCLSALFSASVQTQRCLVCSSVHLCLSSSIAQFPCFHCALCSAFGLRRISSFSHSASLYLPYLSPFCPRHNSRRHSLLMLVLSHSDTHNLNRHMVGCGCHERSDQSRGLQEFMVWCGCHDILIQRCITVPFSTTFLLIFYLSRWGWGWVHIGSLESMLQMTIVSDGTWSIRHQVSLDFSSEDQSDT